MTIEIQMLLQDTDSKKKFNSCKVKNIEALLVFGLVSTVYLLTYCKNFSFSKQTLLGGFEYQF